VLVVGLTGCGGGGGSSPTTATSPIARAIILVSQPSVGLVGLSPTPGYLLRITLPIEVRVTNNTSADLNYVRLRLFRAGVEVERSEVSADRIVALAGTNHVTNDRALPLTVVFGFNTTDFDSAAILIGATDAAGNVIESTLGNLRIEIDPSLQ
jgi:hypothetical protein